MRKRATMAQNWIIDRRTLLMDEPFSALDVHTRQRMETELLTLWDEGARKKTVVFVTHDLEEAIALADEVVVLSAVGREEPYRRAPSGRRWVARRDLHGAADDAGVRRDVSGLLRVGRQREEVIKSQRSDGQPRG